jgi:hypothetical protein
MPAVPPYFSSDALRNGLTQDIQDAADKAAITSDEKRWLLLLVARDAEPDPDAIRPRVDRLTLDDGLAGNAELAGALLISNPDKHNGPVFLSTLAFGIERFSNRSVLLTALQQRFAEISASAIIEAERVEGSLFEARTLAVIRQQARHLDELWTLLQDLPDLRAACGRSLQTLLLARGLGDRIDVFSHIVQIRETTPAVNPAPSSVVGTQYLVDAAVQAFICESLPTGLTRQFLDAGGLTLPHARSVLFEQALSDTARAVRAAYEQLLSDYWTSLRPDGRTAKDAATRALAECFRQHLLSSRAHGTMTDVDYRRVLTLLPSCPDAIDPHAIQVLRLSVSVAGQDHVKLVGVALIEFPADKWAGVYLYSSLQGFLRFSDSAKAIAHILSDSSRAGLLFYSSLNDHASLQMPGSVELRQDALTTGFFAEFVESVIALQKRNLRHVLDLPGIHAQKIPVRIDDALDIRGLLDGRLLHLHDAGRWRSEGLSFDQRWGASAQQRSVQRVLIAEPSYNWIGKLKKLEVMLELVDAQRAGVDVCMRNTLNRYLAVIGGQPLDSRMLWVCPAGVGAAPVRLLSLALDRVCGYSRATLSDSVVLAGLISPVLDRPVQRLPSALLEQILVCVEGDFPQRFEAQLSEFYSDQFAIWMPGCFPAWCLAWFGNTRYASNCLSKSA